MLEGEIFKLQGKVEFSYCTPPLLIHSHNSDSTAVKGAESPENIPRKGQDKNKLFV